MLFLGWIQTRIKDLLFDKQKFPEGTTRELRNVKAIIWGGSMLPAQPAKPQPDWA